MEALIHVGILFAPEIRIKLKGNFTDNSGETFTGDCALKMDINGKVLLTTPDKEVPVILPFMLFPQDEKENYFDLKDVTIGINFHWERKEDQRFRGGLKIIQEEGRLTAVNILPLEEYLKSVISSEMSATSSTELLKAHAVVSRSWLLAQIEKEKKLQQQGPQTSGYFTRDEHIRWYDREDHLNFHVCADDHCQRYQGITKAGTKAVEDAINETSGEVLVWEGEICDARYSKCCGGISEIFENVWEPVNHPYLARIVDNNNEPEGFDTTLDSEEKSVRWIKNSPEAFCNTTDKEILSQVLNDYDQETHDFYRWKKEYTPEELRNLMKKRIGLDVGEIKDLVPVERGVSGRLIKLRVEGSVRTITIGKELEIRKAFSPSHLYSSAFVIDKVNVQEGIPQKFIFTGAGWGHGVGLCQIGAAVMGAKGYNYRQILEHYFRGAGLEKKY
jgi:stage II sporulation protein D